MIPVMEQKIVVAGATGFVGSGVIRLLRKKKLQYIPASLSLGVDFLNFKQTQQFLKKHKPTTIIHAAAYVGGIKFGLDHAGEMYYKNTVMTTNLIEAARISGVDKFISLIGNCAYPGAKRRYLKETEFWDGPLHESVLMYGMVRKAQWAQTWAYQHQYAMKFVNLVFTNMYGPGDHFDKERSHALAALLLKFVKAKEEGIPEVSVWGTGKPVRDWLYIDDGAEAIVRAIDLHYFVDPINVGTGKGVSIKNLALLIKKAVGYKGTLTFDTSKPDGAAFKIMDIKRSKKIFKWQPTTSVEDGIKKTYDWYIGNK